MSLRVSNINHYTGRHKGVEKFKWGHFKFRKLLKESKFHSENSDHFIGQFSSIGSLTESWIKEFLQSLSTSNEKTSDYDFKKEMKSLFHLIYPSANQIRMSKFGYSSGSSFPYYEKTHSKQKWITKYFHKWSTLIGGHNRIMPHCKNWMRVSSDKKDIRMVVTGSHNLSKAAWGCEEKGGTQVHIRSYEDWVVLMGFKHPIWVTQNNPFKVSVVMVPSMFNLDSFKGTLINKILKLPLENAVYQDGIDEPWIVDREYEQVDDYGRVWKVSKE